MDRQDPMCRHTHHHRRNLIVLSVTFCFIQSSYRAIENLQTSLNVDSSLGLTSLSIIYILFAIAGVPAAVFIGYLGTKWTVVLADFFICLYIGSNFYPSFSTMIPTSILVGIWAGPMHAAAAKHRAISARDLASIKSLDTDSVVDRFTGFFFLFVMLSTIPGNIISSIFLSRGELYTPTIDPRGYDPTNLTSSQCGANNCGGFQNIQQPDPQFRQLLLGVLLAIAFVGALMAASLIDHLTEFCDHVPLRKTMKEHFQSISKVLKSQEFLMLVPLMSLNGFEMGFVYGIFTKDYISCSLGIGAVGYVMAVFGAGGVLCAILTAFFARCTGRGRVALLTTAFIGQVALLIAMLLWESNNGRGWEIYLMALALGSGITLRLYLIRVSLGVFFPEDREATMASFMVFHSASLSFCTAISTAQTVCVSHLLYLQIVWLSFAMAVYYVVEWRLREKLAAKQAIAVRKGSQEGMLKLRVRHLEDGSRKISLQMETAQTGC